MILSLVYYSAVLYPVVELMRSERYIDAVIVLLIAVLRDYIPLIITDIVLFSLGIDAMTSYLNRPSPIGCATLLAVVISCIIGNEWLLAISCNVFLGIAYGK